MKLKGVRVLDFSQFLAGPLISAMMADHGADVIKVEAPGGDPTRRGRRKSRDAGTGFFHVPNRGKRSIVLDLKRAESHAIVERLVQWADVVVESYSAGGAARLGIDYARLSAWNPRLVYCSVTSFGQTGSLRDLGSHDPVVQAMAGIFPRAPDGTPVQSGVSVAGLATAFQALSGVLMALLAAKTTGQGDYLDVSMHDVALTLRPQALGTALDSRDTPDEFQHQIGQSLLECYQARDGEWFSLGGREPRFARALFEALGRPDLIAVAAGPSGAAQDPIRAFLRDTFRTMPRQHWLDLLRDKISIGPVLNYAQALTLPQVKERGMIVEDTSGKPHLNTPLRFRHEAAAVNLSVPDLGEDTIDVLREFGFSEPQIDRFLTNVTAIDGTAPLIS